MSQPTIEQLYNEIESLGVETMTCHFTSFSALASPDGYLAIDPARIETTAEERELLIHEEGHFATGTFYEHDSPYTVRKHQESVACRYGYKKYFPVGEIVDAMVSGAHEPWELAEYFGVSQTYINEMLDFYTHAQGIDFAALIEEETAPVYEPISVQTLAALDGVSFSVNSATLTEHDGQVLLQMVEFIRRQKPGNQ